MKTYSMTQECVGSYRVHEEPDGGVLITISVPRRFADLWVTKLSELQTSESEIADYEKPDRNLRLS